MYSEAQGGLANVAVFGDSHAVELAFAVALSGEDADINVKHLSYTSCGPFYKQTKEGLTGCNRWITEVLEGLVNDDNVRTVVLSHRLIAYLYGNHEGMYPLLPDEHNDSHRERLWDSYLAMLNVLLENDKQVIVVNQAPELPKPIENLLLKHGDSSTNMEGVTREWWNKRNMFVSQRLSELPSEVLVVYPEKLFCDEVHCFASKENVALYFDDDHMSVAGATLIADEIIKKL